MAELFMILGFMLAAYAIVGNDSIQTLGTFLYSNSHRPWWVLWLFSSTIMSGVILYGWVSHDKDASYSRLNKVYDKSVSIDDGLESIEIAKRAMQAGPAQEQIIKKLQDLSDQLVATKNIFIKDPEQFPDSLHKLNEVLRPLHAELENEDVPNPQRVTLESVIKELNTIESKMEKRRDVSNFIDWTYLIPPLALLILTRLGFPVSTSFLVLITFQPLVMGSMLTKSLMGYVVAMVSALVIYLVVMRTIESRWKREGEEGITSYWVALQWASTGFLWSMWLVQDMANIFVYLPRRLEVSWLAFAIVWMVAVQAVIYYSRGGKIQKVVTSKTNTHDIRSATIVDLLYGVILYIFKIQSNVPMSTTWVFLGLLAGREIAFALSSHGDIKLKRAFKLARKDIVKAGFGLGVSVIIAMLINRI